MLPRYVVLLSLFLLPGTSPAIATDEAESAADDEILRAAHLSTDGPGLLTFFRKRTLSEETQAHVQAMIVQLGHESFELREEASAELVSMGPGAAGLLRGAARHPDLEVRWRARQALDDIRRDGDPSVLATAARVLGRRRPAGTAEVLLAYLPCAEDAIVADEVCLSLASVALREGKADPLLVRALADNIGVKRGAAGAALWRAGCREQRPAVLRLLHDSDPLVRQRVALTLVETREKAAVPVLIALLTELPHAEAERVEELLVLLAGERSPRGDLDGDARSCRRYQQAWEKWWTRYGASLNLARVEGLGRSLGLTLVVQLDMPGSVGRVLELDAAGRTRWQIDGLQYPIDAQILDAQRVLITEYSRRRVTERNHKGEVLWQTQVDSSPISARRLPNGNTFIATRTRIYEVDRGGAEVWALTHHLGYVVAACPLRDGQVGLVSNTGEFQRLDRAGNILKSFPMGRILRSIGTHIQVLPNGHVLMPIYTGNCVIEYDGDGKPVWTAQAYRPTSAQRLPNGHTIISSRQSDVIVEVDRRGQEVWSHRCEGRPLRVLRR
jgi:HEAT repeat protein